MGAPTKGTRVNDDGVSFPIILGTSGNDKLQGKAGNDLLKGGAGSDDIDGGQGFDTALFTGSFFDYDFVIKGTGNDKVTVIDRVANRDGADNLKQVEALQFADVTIRLDQNNAAVTRADTAITDEDSRVVINVLANDRDFEGDALTITKINGQSVSVGQALSLGNGASVTLNANQTLVYDPGTAFQPLNDGQQGFQAFTYTIADSKGALSAPTAVNITVDGVFDPPVVTHIVDGASHVATPGADWFVYDYHDLFTGERFQTRENMFYNPTITIAGFDPRMDHIVGENVGFASAFDRWNYSNGHTTQLAHGTFGEFDANHDLFGEATVNGLTAGVVHLEIGNAAYSAEQGFFVHDIAVIDLVGLSITDAKSTGQTIFSITSGEFFL
ncbi:MAG: uncharacterized protein QOF14_5723 [Hyphomicrobiales bacterium]|nr:uncharacterized protein [Hyphomicrobiales bacterium]